MAAAHVPYRELARLADRLFAVSGDDEDRLAKGLDNLDPETRHELLTSDLLNAFQVFYYYFREKPEELEEEMMILQPASALKHGVLIREADDAELYFAVEGEEPVIVIADGEEELARFHGMDAYRRGIRYLEGDR